MVLIYRTLEITPLAEYGRDRDFTHNHVSPTHPARFRSRLAYAGPTFWHQSRIASDHDASLGEEILDIPEAERESVVEPYGVTDDFRRVAVTAITNKLGHTIMVHECLSI